MSKINTKHIIGGKEMSREKQIKLTILGGIVGVVVAVVLLSISFVPVNSVGVRYNNFSGNITEKPLDSGLKFKVPFIERITDVSTELRSADIDDIKVTTKDSQSAEVDIEIQYRVLPEDAVETFKQFRSTPEEDWIDTFVYQQIQRGVQEAASQYTVSELRGEKRGLFQTEVDNTVSEALMNNHLTLQGASVDDIAVSEAILQSIEAHAKAKQDVETAKQVQTKQEVENETKVKKAEAEAEVKRIESEAEALANKNLSEGITKELVDYLEALARQDHGWYKYNNMEPQIVESGE